MANIVKLLRASSRLLPYTLIGLIVTIGSSWLYYIADPYPTTRLGYSIRARAQIGDSSELVDIWFYSHWNSATRGWETTNRFLGLRHRGPGVWIPGIPVLTETSIQAPRHSDQRWGLLGSTATFIGDQQQRASHHPFAEDEHTFVTVDLPNLATQERAVGWPFLALQNRQIESHPGEWKHTGGFSLPNFAYDLLPTDWQVRAIPYRPIWPGLIFNSIFYATLAFITHRLYRTIREHRRFTKGHCPKCKYDLNADFAPGCPECGWRRKADQPTPA